MAKTLAPEGIPEAHFFAADQPRATLLRSALLCFVEDGFGGVSMSQIAERAGTSKQRLIYHFKRPEELLSELAKMWGESGRQVTLEHLAALMNAGPVEKSVGMSDGMFLWMKRYPNFAKLTPVIGQAVHKSRLIQEFQTQTFETGLNRITSLVSLCPKFDKTSTETRLGIARGLYCLIQGAGHFVINNNQFENLEVYRSATAQTILALLSD